MGNSNYYTYIAKLKMLGIQFSDNVIADTKDTKVIEVSINPDDDSVDKPIRYFMIHKSTGLAEEIAEDCQNILRAQNYSLIWLGLANLIIMYNKNTETHILGYNMHIAKNELKDNIQIINITGSIVGAMQNQDKKAR